MRRSKRGARVPLIELATSTAEVAAAIADAPVRIALHEEADTSLAKNFASAALLELPSMR